MTHDPLCPWQGYERVPDGVCWHCDLIAKVSDQERWSTVNSAVYVASQAGAVPELVELLSRLYESPEDQRTETQRHEAAAELVRMAQELRIIP